MPSFVRFIAGVFLVFPGIAMWLPGAFLLLGYSSTIPGAILRGHRHPDGPILFLYFTGISIVLIVSGYSMIASFDLLTTKRRYDLPGKHVLPCIGMELVVQILGILCFGVTISSLLAFWNLQGASPWLAALLFLAGFGGCSAAIWIHKQTLVLRSRWKAAHTASLPQDGLNE